MIKTYFTLQKFQSHVITGISWGFLFLFWLGIAPNGVFAQSGGNCSNDTTPPVLLNVPADQTIDCDAPLPADPVTATDNCGTPFLLVENIVGPNECSPGLSSWWPAEGNGIDVQDSLNAALINGTTFTGGIAGQAFSFDGVDDYLETGPTNFASNSYSVVVWINTSDSTNQAIFAATDTLTGLPGVQVTMDSAGRVSFLHRAPFGTSGGTVIQSGPGYNDGQWHQIAAVMGDTVQRLLVDNVSQGTAINYNNINAPTKLTIGRLSFLAQADNQNFDGLLDENRVYARALCSPEIQSLYLAGIQNNTWAPTYKLTRVYTAFDSAGNFVTDDYTITVQDTTPPTLTVPAPITVQCVANGGIRREHAAVSNWLNSANSEDDCTCTVLTYNSPSFFPSDCQQGITYTVTWTAVDDCGNTISKSSTLTVVDTVAPTLTCPNVTAQTLPDTCGGAFVNFNATAYDACQSANTPITYSHQPGDFFPLGTTTVYATTADNCGNADSCSFTVTVSDQTAPLLTCPASFTTYTAPTNCSAIPSWPVPSVSDACGIASLNSTSSLGSAFTVGTTSISYTAIDVNGNSSNCTFQVTVLDTISPVLNCPANVTVFAAPNTCTASASWPAPTATDACGIASIASPSANSAFPVGSTTLTYSATDVNGNTSTCNFQVTVIDTTAPTLACPAPLTVNTDANSCDATPSLPQPSASDACGLASVTSNFPPGSTFPLGTNTVVYTATDVNNNVATCTTTVTVIDSTAPQAVCQNITVALNTNGIATITAADIDGGSTDNCGIATLEICNGNPSPVTTCTTIDFNAFSAGTHLTTQLVDQGVTYISATGGIGQAWIFDSSNPTGGDFDLGTPNQQFNGPGVGSGGATNTTALGKLLIIQENYSTPDDNVCGGDLNFNFASARTVSSITIVDNEGNNSYLELTTTNGTVTLPIPATGDNGVVEVAVNTDNVTALKVHFANSGGVAELETCSNAAPACGVFTCADLGDNPVTLTVTDASGNVSTCTATVTVEDGSFLEIVCPADIATACEGNGGAHVTWNAPQVNFSSNCSNNSCNGDPHIPGFIYLGERNGSRYYCSNSANYSWAQAQAAAQAAGGALVTIEDAQENAFITNAIAAPYVWIGLADETNENQFNWKNGSPVSFTNWQSGEPNNVGGTTCYGQSGADYTVLRRATGTWYDRGGCGLHEFVMEVTCGPSYTLQQVAGPASGDFFPSGTTTVTYVAYTDTDTATCSFDVTVEECPLDYCHAAARCSGYEWIKNVKLGAINKWSGSNGGYADFTNSSTTLQAGSSANITLKPGFSGQYYNEYWRVYIDWNRDGDFYDAGEMVYQGNGSNTKYGSIQVPANAATGALRMRVMMRWGQYPAGPCCTYYYGEVEDYTVYVDGSNSRLLAGSMPDDNADFSPETVETSPTAGFEFSSVYPNPVSPLVNGLVNLEFRSGTAETVSIQVMDLQGRVLSTVQYEAQLGANRVHVDVSRLATGTYLLELQGSTTRQTEKLVVQ